MIRKTDVCMGGPWEVIAHGPPDRCHRAVDAVYREIKRIEALLSRFRPDSEISRINRQLQRWTGPGVIQIDPEVGRILAQALRLAALTEGAFDPTTGALSRLWGFGPDGPRSVPPNTEQIRMVLKRVGYRKVWVDETRATLTIAEPGLEFDLGGMGKGYAVDRAAAILRLHNIEHGFVSCGSTSFALGTPPRLEDGWRIGIRDPRRPDRAVQTVQVRNRAVSTSGAYEKFFLFDGKHHGHICDPRTGYPVAGTAGVTVTAPTATEADALSTAAYVLGADAGKTALKSWEGVEGCFIKEEDGERAFETTPGWEAVNQGGFQNGLNRRRFIAGILSALGLLILKPSGAAGAIYLTEEEAIRRIFPEGREFVKETLTLTAEQKTGVGEKVGKRIEEEAYTVYHVILDHPNLPIGYGMVLNVIGKERPITFMIGVNPQGRIVGIEILTYRESQGSEIRSRRFIGQFIGKNQDAPLKLGRDIDGVSGATLSSRSTAYAVKKALALTQVAYGIRAERSP